MMGVGPHTWKAGDSCAETGTEMSASTVVMVREGGPLLRNGYSQHAFPAFHPAGLLDAAIERK